MKKNFSSVDQACDDNFLATHKLNDAGRWTVRLPFKSFNSLAIINLHLNVFSLWKGRFSVTIIFGSQILKFQEIQYSRFQRRFERALQNTTGNKMRKKLSRRLSTTCCQLKKRICLSLHWSPIYNRFLYYKEARLEPVKVGVVDISFQVYTESSSMTASKVIGWFTFEANIFSKSGSFHQNVTFRP